MGRRALRATMAAAALTAAGSGTAGAATLSIETIAVGDGSVNVLMAAGRDGEPDRLHAFQDGVIVKFSVFYSDPGDTFEGSPLPTGCTISSTGGSYGTQVECDFTKMTTEVQAVGLAGLGGADDLDASASSGSFVAVPVFLLGGSGADTLRGGVHIDFVDAGEGNDKLLDTAGADHFDGGAGDDELESGVNGDQDVFDGGEGTDTGVFIRGQAFTVSLNQAADDGIADEKDDVRVENLSVEGSGATFVGDAGPNTFTNQAFGGDGGRKNRFEGGGGNDRLLGGGGVDELIGGDGDDELRGSDGNDLLDGGGGIDSFVGDQLDAHFANAPGDDVILARDGNQETISCGMGADRAQVDAGDVLPVDGQNFCEAVDRPSTPGPGPGPGPVDEKVSLGAKGIGLVRPRRDRRAPFVFRLRGKLDAPAAKCAGSKLRVTAKRGKRRVKRMDVTVGADCSWRATLKLGRRKGRYAVQLAFLGGPGLNAAPARKVTLRAG